MIPSCYIYDNTTEESYFLNKIRNESHNAIEIITTLLLVLINI